MMWGRLLGLTAILLQVAVFLQPLLPEKQHFSSVCETIAQALFLERTAPHSSYSSTHHETATHVALELESSHEHASSEDAAHTDHECEYCLVYSFALPLFENKLRPILVRTQIRILSFKTSFTPTLFQTEPLFILPQGRAPPRFDS